MAFQPYTRKPITDIFTSRDTDINRRECRRIVPMRVLALGLGRTGTASVENPPDCLMWSDALAAKYDGKGQPFAREQWDQLTGHCQAICDWPSVAFAEELVDSYPDAKVILTTRDVDSWHESTLKTVHWRATEPTLKWVSNFDWAAGLYQPMLSKFWTEFWEGDFEKNGKRRFQEHYDHVASLVPNKDNLLVYKVSQGWEPLCQFLDVPVPETMFPRTNDTGGFVDRCQKRNRMQMYNALFRAVVVGSTLGGAVLGLTLTVRRAMRRT